jgi:hypothetical protein
MDELDYYFAQIKLADGSYRGFTANQMTFALTGTTFSDMRNDITRELVLRRGNPGGFDSCGRWMGSAHVNGSHIDGFIHVEGYCDYEIGQTHWSLTYARSADEGLTWSTPRQIITGMIGPLSGKYAGDGGCTVVNGGDRRYYAYCLRTGEGPWATIVARAPIATPGPGHWHKYYNDAWNEPGLGGNATPLRDQKTGLFGTGVGRLLDKNNIVLLTVNPYFHAVFGGELPGGLQISFSGDRIQFQSVEEPLIPLDEVNWNRLTPPFPATELFAYPSILNHQTDSSNLVNIGTPFIVAQMWIPPGGGFGHRYLVFHPVTISISPTAISGPHVRLALTRWWSKDLLDRWSTTGPLPENSRLYALDASLGYLMTKPPAPPSAKLIECFSNWPGHPDHLLTNETTCPSPYTKLRTAGWAYQGPQTDPATVPLYRCYNDTDRTHFTSNDPDCESLGRWNTPNALLGYALER